MKKPCLLPSLLLLLLMWPGSTFALDVRIEGNRLSVRADHVPLQSILTRIGDQGVRVRIDAEINPVVSASFSNRDLQKGLASILTSVNHVLLWESVEGPLGPMTRLAEIQVFRPGKEDRMRPLLQEESSLQIVKDPRNGNLYVAQEILVKPKPAMTPEAFTALLVKWRATVVDSTKRLGLYRVRVPEDTDIPALVDEISKHPGMEEAEPNFVYPMPGPYASLEEEVPDTGHGKLPREGGMPIAILDSGLAPVEGLGDHVLASFDAVQPEEAISDPLGHGTQMALIAAGVVKPHGAGSNREFQSPIIPVRAFDENGYTSNHIIMRSIDFALAKGARVMSLSWGAETNSRFLGEAFAYAESRGMVILASAGNEPTGKPIYPAAYSSVLGVGALGPEGERWEKSNWGDFVTLAAPGFATLPVGYKGDPGTYAGTSISTAYAANVVADYLSRNPEASIEDILGSFRVRE